MGSEEVSQWYVLCEVLKMQCLHQEIYEIFACRSRAKTAA